MALLEIAKLRTQFTTPRGVLKAVDEVSLSIDQGEVVALVGESGCGKTVTAFSILGLIPDPPGRIVGGSIRFAGRELIGIPAAEMRAIRGGEIAMIFQDPMTSLNPALTVGEQIGEAIIEHKGGTRRAALSRAAELLDLVRVPDPQRRVHDYPHRLSGGMRQRAMIAMALACEPQLIIADEPTTALDVTVQAQILDLLKDLADRTGSALVLITHDLGVVARYADRVVVMYAGRVVESAPATELYARPRHPYTQGLMASVPRLDGDTSVRLVPIEGQPPDLARIPAGCAFAPRCRQASDACRSAPPLLREIHPGHSVACLLDA